MTDQEIDHLIANWHILNKSLKNLSESEVKRGIHRELVGNRRPRIVHRLHTRYCTLRQQRELSELIASIEQPVFMAASVELE